jgi:hypothetical protein
MSVMFTKFADKPRPVLLDLKAASTAEQLLGYGLHQIVGVQSGPRAYVVILWAGLNRKDSNLALDDAFRLVQDAFKAKTLDITELQLFVLRQLQSNGILPVDVAGDDESEGESQESAGPLAV